MSPIVMDTEKIKSLLPHRYPFLLVDRVLELEPGKKIKALKNVTANEEFFNGHFPGYAVMPGVLQLEAMAQTAGLMMTGLLEDAHSNKIILFGGAKELRFRKPVVPGDSLILEAELIKMKSGIIKAKTWAKVGEDLVCEAEIVLMITDNPNAPKPVNKNIHATAIIDPSAQIGPDVKIGAYSVIKANVQIGQGTIIEEHVVIEENVSLGAQNHIHCGTVIGDLPEDLKYSGEFSGVKIGDRNQIREYVTINRATGENQYTELGDDNIIMAQAHIAHNVKIGSEVVIVSLVQIAGHARIEDQVVIGGMVGIPQFISIGRMAMIGGYARVFQDIPPFMLCAGNPAEISSINLVGLRRRKIDGEIIDLIKKAYKLLYRSGNNTTQALEQIREECLQDGALPPEIEHLIGFIEKSHKGINRSAMDDEDMAQNMFLGLTSSAGFFERMKGMFKKS